MAPVKTEDDIMLEGKTQTTLEWPQSVALAVVVFEKNICNPGKHKKAGKDIDLRYRSPIAGRDEKTDNHRTGQHAKN